MKVDSDATGRTIADANFLVSAFATRRLSPDVFQPILAEHELMTGEYFLKELQRGLTKNPGFAKPPVNKCSERCLPLLQ